MGATKQQQTKGKSATKQQTKGKGATKPEVVGSNLTKNITTTQQTIARKGCSALLKRYGITKESAALAGALAKLIQEKGTLAKAIEFVCENRGKEEYGGLHTFIKDNGKPGKPPIWNRYYFGIDKEKKEFLVNVDLNDPENASLICQTNKGPAIPVEAGNRVYYVTDERMFPGKNIEFI